MNQVLDCFENSSKQNSMPTFTINLPGSSKIDAVNDLKGKTDTVADLNGKTSENDSSANIVESLEDVLKIEVKTDSEILIKDEDILPVDHSLEEDTLAFDKSYTEELKETQTSIDKHDKSVEEVEVMKQEMDPCDVFIEENKESPNVSLDEIEKVHNVEESTNVTINRILINRDNNTIVFLPANYENTEKSVEYNDLSSDSEDSIQILPKKRKTSCRTASLVDLAEDIIELSSENDENSIEIFDDDILVIDWLFV